MTRPAVEPTTLLQDAMVTLFGVESLISCNLIPVHGLLELHSNLTAFCVDDVPLIFLYVTLLILTPELY